MFRILLFVLIAAVFLFPAHAVLESDYEIVEAEVVNAMFRNDTIEILDEQRIFVDVRGENILTVEAMVRHPDGMLVYYPLSLTDGTRGYGTWEGVFSPGIGGSYALVAVNVWGPMGSERVISLDERGFIITDESEEVAEERVEPEIVHVLLEPDVLRGSEQGTIMVDIIDPARIESLDVVFEHENDAFILPLDRREQSGSHSSWKASFTIGEPGEYAAVEVRVETDDGSRTYPVSDRKITREDLSEEHLFSGLWQLQQPYHSTLFAFTIAAALFLVFVSARSLVRSQIVRGRPGRGP